jgi:hypothetical protein
MKLSTIRTTILRNHLSIYMSIAVLFFSFSCTKSNSEEDAPGVTPKTSTHANSVSTNTEPTVPVVVSDVDVFKAVMFIEGPLSTRLAEFEDFNIRSLTTDQVKIDQSVAFQDEVIEKLLQQNPAYLSEFRNKISQGDYFLVKSTVEQAGNDIMDIAMTMTGESKDDVINSSAAMATSFMEARGINSQSSIEDISIATQQEAGVQDGDVVNVHYIAAVSWLVAAAVAVIVIVIFAYADSAGTNTFFYDSYLSAVTLQFHNI